MTPEQKYLSRSALGLDGKRKESYRNRFYCYGGTKDHKAWTGLVESGLATCEPAKTPVGMDFFYLTHQGATLALEGRERLDTEDFPEN